ncbi:unnamed protein product [Oreochromis niloticus]|nr:unnamed protein product [Mustela putorius furo]
MPVKATCKEAVGCKEDTGRLEAVVGPYKLFDSSFRTLQGSRWLSDEIVNISAQKILLIDPMGNEGVYDRKILRNWRNFLRMRWHEDTMEWQLQTTQLLESCCVAEFYC